VAHVAGTEAAEAALLKALYDEHAAVLWRYAMRLTGDASRAEDVVQETLLRAWQHPEVMDDPERSPRAWLFTVARNMIIDERRSPRFRMTASSLDDSSTPEQSTPDQVNATLDRMLIADAMTQLSGEHRAVIERSYYRGCHETDRRRSRNRRGDHEVPIALWRAGTPTHAARDGGDTVTTLRPTPMLIAPKANWCKAISVEPSPCCFPSARPSAVCTR
jgi:RNA polymerase sigma-70 factor, ECF subfamily